MRTFFIAIISFIAGISECTDPVVAPPQTVFDLPGNTPGLMQGKQIKKVCGQDKECVHVIVPGTDAENAYNDSRMKPLNAKERSDYATFEIGNIYFPSDGTQPTTPEAAEYSCANVDAYNEHSPVTKWYMQMFGYKQAITSGKAFKAIDGSAPTSKSHIIDSLENILKKNQFSS